MQSARYARPRPPRVTISSTSMMSRPPSIVARVLIIGSSQKSAQNRAVYISQAAMTQWRNICRIHAELTQSGYESYGAYWTHKRTPIHQIMHLQAQIRPATADTNNSTSFCKLRQCNIGRQCTAGDGGLMYCCGWSRRGEARRLQWHQLRHHTYQRAVEDRRGRDANAAEEVQRACSCCMAPDYQRLTLSHTMPPSLPPCNPPLPYNHLV
jgi:hypothetical protein